jgi:hypothetical protein
MFALGEDWSRAGVEPGLDELMNDPLVHLVMRRDHVAPPDVLKALARARGHLCKPEVSPRTQMAQSGGRRSGSEADA